MALNRVVIKSFRLGQVAKWPTTTDCKSVLSGVRWFESILAHVSSLISGSSSFGRAIAFQAIGGEFEPRLPLRIGNDNKRMRVDRRLSLSANNGQLCACYKSRCRLRVEHPDPLDRDARELKTHQRLNSFLKQAVVA